MCKSIIRYHLLLLTAAITCINAAAKENEDTVLYSYLHPKLFQGRLFLGLNFCQVYGDAYAGYHKVGINAGGTVYTHFSPIFGVSLEILYSQKGVRGGNVKESYTVGTYIDKYYLNLDYAETALMLHFDQYILDFEAGMSYGVLLKSDEWAEADVPIYINPKLTYFNAYDIDYVAGLSMQIDKHWSINMRYQHSITSIRPQERVPYRYSDGSPNERNDLYILRVVYSL